MLWSDYKLLFQTRLKCCCFSMIEWSYLGVVLILRLIYNMNSCLELIKCCLYIGMV